MDGADSVAPDVLAWMDGCWWIKCGEQREEEGSPVIADGERLLRTIERGRATH